MHRSIWLFAVCCVFLAACGGSGDPDSAPGAGAEATTTTVAASEASTTTSTATTSTTSSTTTTTTVPPTGEELLLAAVDAAGLRPAGADDDSLLSIATELCADAASVESTGFFGAGKSPWETSLPVGVFTSPLFDNPRPERPGLDAVRFAVLTVEQLCAESAAVLGASSAEWSRVLDQRSFTAGTCFRNLGALGGVSEYAIVTDCADPHSGEVVGIVEAPEGSAFPFGSNRDQALVDNLFQQCGELTADYFGSGDRNISFGYGFRAAARDQAAWDAGERRFACTVSVDAPVLRGSLAGEHERFVSAADGFDLTVSTCSNEEFEATITNGSAVPVSVVIRFSEYFPTGSYYYVIEENLAPGASTSSAETFLQPRDDTPTNCDRRLVQVVALP